MVESQTHYCMGIQHESIAETILKWLLGRHLSVALRYSYSGKLRIMREWDVDCSVPVEPSGSRLRQHDPPERRGTLAVSEAAGSVGHGPMSTT
ncbi:hypothetical protein SAMN06309944_0997 [Micrococcales bacterium KH10]|nr:hypothetical protein SAMN06309944_0997 [Micrococcales bacterium KH10]